MMIACDYCGGTGIERSDEYDPIEEMVVVSGVQCPRCKGRGEKDSDDE